MEMFFDSMLIWAVLGFFAFMFYNEYLDSELVAWIMFVIGGPIIWLGYILMELKDYYNERQT
jgi:hypothetical protein